MTKVVKKGVGLSASVRIAVYLVTKLEVGSVITSNPSQVTSGPVPTLAK